MKKLSKEQIINLHSALIAETGGIDGVADDSLLDSALNAPFQSFGGFYQYPSIYQKAARLGFGLVKNHAFIDGNKRIGAHSMLIFLELNGISLVYNQNELSDIILRVADGSVGYEKLLDWIIRHEK
ncbi:MAG: type II toxin-antitoxin system death-on-curing family toxin [Firmicutes bacterium]|nr:type II toxin-antitoxin system death-on-curing family toxin [Bacillota bacterium]